MWQDDVTEILLLDNLALPTESCDDNVTEKKEVHGFLTERDSIFGEKIDSPSETI